MQAIHTQPKKLYDNHEKSLSLNAFEREDRGDYLGAIERDIRGLMRRLAEQKLEHAEDSKKQHAEMQSLLMALINDLSDSFERVFDVIQKRKEYLTPKTKVWIGNFRTIYKLLQKILSERGVVPINNLEEGFDPYRHKAVDTIEDPSKEDGTIIEEVKKGYVRHETVLRKTEVVVVRNMQNE